MRATDMGRLRSRLRMLRRVRSPSASRRASWLVITYRKYTLTICPEAIPRSRCRIRATCAQTDCVPSFLSHGEYSSREVSDDAPSTRTAPGHRRCPDPQDSQLEAAPRLRRLGI